MSIADFMQIKVNKTGFYYKIMDMKGLLHGNAALIVIQMHLRG